MDDEEQGFYERFGEPWEGLPEEDAAWNWELEDVEENGDTKFPPDDRDGWRRWYFWYHKPTCTHIKISADKDPETGEWYNPHPSSG